MNNIDDILQAIFIGLVVATFLLNTGRALKGIEVCKECLIFLNKKVLKTKAEMFNSLHIRIYITIFRAYCLIPDHKKALIYGRKLLDIFRKRGNKDEEGILTVKLADMYRQQCKYLKARELYEKAINITKEIGDKKNEAYTDEEGEANSYGNLGKVFTSLGDYDKAKEYLEKALAIRIQIADKEGEANSYGNLGPVFTSLGEYDKAKKYLEKALVINIQIGDKQGEASSYGNLGTVFTSLVEYDNAKEYLEKGEATDYGNLGTVFTCLAEYDKAKEYLEKALAIEIRIGDKQGEASSYGNLGSVFTSLGEYDKAKEYLEKSLAISIRIGHKEGEAAVYGNLGTLFAFLGEYIMAEDYIQSALSITRDIEDLEKEFKILCLLTVVKLFQNKIQEAFDCLFLGMKNSECLRRFLGDNDDFKVLSSDVHDFPYRNLSAFLCFGENPNHALYVLELARARALADLMASQYSVESHISADPQSWIGIENIMKKESNSSCLYISYYDNDLFFWVLKTSGIIHFRRMRVGEKLVGTELGGKLDDFFATSFRSFGIVPEEDCEDRSLNDVQSVAALRLIEEEDEESGNSESSVSLYYRMLIIPVADLLEEPELIVVPDRCLNRVPFPALADEGGKYLSENFRIRIVPSLTTLKLIQNSPADYHSQTGALIVGDPAVGMVRYKGMEMLFSRLPGAASEAAMIGRRLGVEPLLGEKATKQAVLDRLHSVSLIHFAAHGNAERGEIALSPVRRSNRTPEEEDYLLRMFDIAKVQLRTKLVVLSCCHSACGQIRAEGVVGIARAFLGSGARSVLVALWAISDKATEQLMRHFYEHLVRGESASESLHQAMKWMRGNGFNKVDDWAPFMLIGDNVTFDFGKACFAPASYPGSDIEIEDGAQPFPEYSHSLNQKDDLIFARSNSVTRLKLVVLSCCHSACGQIRAEGVVGIARAFLGSGARSVLVALWAISDKATEQLMRHFYEHLVRGESASESLHQAMKWMRGNGFNKVDDWAPFMLIGDNVTFDFGK
ncbi:tetratricopeptide repeat protein 28-like [Orbicella faveolata]|uniref:tetratricopeptide repeat protein 28-like n=1 Tax=Orbicella faveolata TaxID=48498 RepID=UPI0009E39EE5|nr:tetratricopeptide repeat protein 28-like [Orbicella faveolata]